MLLKPTKIRSKKITQSAKGEPCYLRLTKCSGRDTVVFCHGPSPKKGTGTKSDDTWGAPACSNCHQYADNNQNDPQVWRAWLRSIAEYQNRLFQQNLIEVQ